MKKSEAAEALAIAALSGRSPGTKEGAMAVLMALAAAGRVKSPSVGRGSSSGPKKTVP